jgi:glutaconate CoA-transferase subunit B
VDRYGNLNSTVVGKYADPAVRLPGSGGATEIAVHCGRVFIIMPHGARAFVEKLDFLTSLGHGPTGRERQALGVTTEGPTLIVTDLCTMRPHPETHEFEVATLHPGVTRERVAQNTGWTVRFRNTVDETPPPTDDELAALRDLMTRTARAHGTGDVS